MQIQRLNDKQEAMWKLMNNINYEWKETDNNAYSVNTKYIRCSYVSKATPQIEQGTQATDYAPYRETVEIPLADKTIPFNFEVEGNGSIEFHNSAETKDNIQSNTKYFIALNEVK